MMHYDRNEIILKFKYDPASQKDLLKRAEGLVGLKVKEVIKKSPLAYQISNPNNKGSIGNIIEKYWFGIKNNSSPEPDFIDLGIELKVIPLEERYSNLTVKERTKVCSINYFELIKEQWDSSHAKKKLNKILFVYYIYNSTIKSDSIVKYCDIWELKGLDALIIKNDWHIVKKKVGKGFAHLLSESLSKILGACTTGQGRGRDFVQQPKSSIKAKKRAFSLKQSFTRQLWLEIFKNIKYESIFKSLKIKSIAELEKSLLVQLDSFKGMTLETFTNKFSLALPNGKNAAATIVKKAIGFKNVNSKIKEFDQLGIEIRIVPVRSSDDKPWEAVSFPAFKMKELVNEKWEDSELHEQVDRILFVPIYRDERKTPLKDRVIGRAFFWSPSDKEWDIIKKEWKMYKRQIKQGKSAAKKVKIGIKYKEVTGLAKESDTKIIHIRPHGKNSSDRDLSLSGINVVKQSFWLNKYFVHRLIKKHAR